MIQKNMPTELSYPLPYFILLIIKALFPEYRTIGVQLRD